MSISISVRGKKRMFQTFGPFEKMRMTEGRYLEVRENGFWRTLAFAIPLIAPPKWPGRRKVNIGPPSKPQRHYALWRFLSPEGKETGLDAEHWHIKTTNAKR